MSDFETTKREQYEIERLNNPTFGDLDGKFEALAEIQKVRQELLQEMGTNENPEERQALQDILYDLKTARHNVELRMADIARGRRG